jgi:hypothetical protein
MWYNGGKSTGTHQLPASPAPIITIHTHRPRTAWATALPPAPRCTPRSPPCASSCLRVSSSQCLWLRSRAAPCSARRSMQSSGCLHQSRSVRSDCGMTISQRRPTTKSAPSSHSPRQLRRLRQEEQTIAISETGGQGINGCARERSRSRATVAAAHHVLPRLADQSAPFRSHVSPALRGAPARPA